MSPLITKTLKTSSLHGAILESWGNTLLCLIPKFNNPSKASQLRPISFCTTYYKIHVKLLSNRMKPLLPLLI